MQLPELSEEEVQRMVRGIFLRAAFDMGGFYVPPVDVLEIEAQHRMHGHFNVIHTDTAFRADVYVAGADALSQRALERRRPISLGEETVRLAPPPKRCPG